MKKKVSIVGVLLFIAVLAAGSYPFYESLFKKTEKVPDYVFTYAENQSTNYPTTQGAMYFAQLVEEKTGGRIKIIVYAGGELGRESDVITQMQYGGVDFARISLSQLAEVDDRLNVLQMPYLYNDANHMWDVLEGAVGEKYLNEVWEYDLKGLSWYDAGSRNFYSTTPILSPEDMVGKRIRVQQSDLMTDMVNCLGAVAVPLSYEEVYSALELGSIDGAENNWPSYEDTGHYEVANYFIEDEHTRVPEMQICAGHTWDLLSDEDKKIVMECAKESAIYERDLWAEREKVSRENAVLSGVIVTEITPEEKEEFRELMAPVYEKYCSEYMEELQMIIEEGKVE